MDACETPVVFIVFNRPNVTRMVFSVIREVQPKTLLLIADGPRLNNENDFINCKEVLEIVEAVDWPCNIYRNYSGINLGCRRRLATGLDWVFTLVDRAIILEDDCLPDPSFFRFCTEMLDKYEHAENVMHISGFNRLSGKIKATESYIFSRFGSIWGWATWKRAWKLYDVDMRYWETIKRNKEFRILGKTKEEIEWRTGLFDKVHNGEIDTWDYQWVFARIIHRGLSIIPIVNLISNIGFGEDATHTKDVSSKNANREIYRLEQPIVHQKRIKLSNEYDAMYLQEIFSNCNSLSTRFKAKIGHFLRMLRDKIRIT